MYLATISTNGQITVPIDIRNKLGLRAGDKMLFVKQGNQVIVSNASELALEKAQKAFSGAAKKIGLQNETDVDELVSNLRKGE